MSNLEVPSERIGKGEKTITAVEALPEVYIDRYQDIPLGDEYYDAVCSDYEDYLQDEFQDAIEDEIFDKVVSYIRLHALNICEFLTKDDIEPILQDLLEAQ